MKFARLALAPLPLVLMLSHGCSDPPAPPAEAALTLNIKTTSGAHCAAPIGQLSIPTAMAAASVLQELNCDLSTGCKVDDYVLVDRDQGATVSCTVSPAGDNYTVSLNLNYDGSAVGQPSMFFTATGSVSATGGQLSVTENNSVAGAGGQQDGCLVTIMPPRGLVKKGSIWASFDCPMFRDPSNIGDTGCDMQGIFLFENCGG
jgi:hypothetical protein